MDARCARAVHLIVALLNVAALVAATTTTARAASGSWTGAVDSVWANPANWSLSPAPGSGETAIFDGFGNGNTTIDLGAGVTVGAIQFDGFTDPYTIGAGQIGNQTLTLNDSGFIDMSPSTQSSQLFKSSLLLGSATAGSYTFSNSSMLGTLTFAGPVQGGTGGTAAAKTLTISGGGETAISGLVSNGGASSLALSMEGSGTLTFAGTSLATGATSVNAGTLGLAGVLAGGGAVTVGSGGTLSQSAGSLIGVNNATTLNVNGAATLAGSNQYTGATTVNNGGVLNIRSGLALGTTGAGTTINAGGELRAQGGIYTLAEALALNGSGAAGGGSLRNTSGVNTYLGAITLGSAARINSDSGRLNLGNTITNGANLLTFGGAGDVTAQFIIGNGAGGLTKDGAGTLAVFGANTYTGTTTLGGGTLLLGSAETAGTSGPLGRQAANAAGTIVFSGGSLQYSPQNNADYSGRFSTALNQMFRIDTNGRDVTYASALASDGGSLVKYGPGTLTLASGNNSYSGGTTVSGGTLLVTGSVPGIGTTTVASGGSLSMVNGTTATLYPDTLSLVGGANLAFDWSGATADSMYLSLFSPSSALGPIGITLSASGTPSGSPTLINAPAGGLAIGGATYYLANSTNYSASLSWDDMTLNVGSYAAATPLTTAYWVGNTLAGTNTAGVDNAMALSNGTTSNWSSSATHAATPLVPGAATDVFFTSAVSGATPSQQSNVVLGSSMSVRSLTFNDTTPVTIANDGSFLQLNSTGTGAASAISTNENATINAGVVLGVNQTWTTAAGRTLTVAGQIGNVNAGAGLTIAGPGVTRITGTAAYSGATTVNNGATLEFAAGSRKTYLGSGSTFSVNGVANIAGDLDVHLLAPSTSTAGFNGVMNVTSGGTVTVRGAAGGQDQAVNIGGGGYGALIVASGGGVTVLSPDAAGAVGSMNMQNGGSQGLLRITGGTVNVGTIMIARNGGGTSEVTITDGLLFKPGGTFNLGDRGGFTTVLNVAGGLVDNTSQQLTWGRSGGTAGGSQIVTNFNAGTIVTKEFGVPNQANFQVVTNYNGGTVKVSPGVNANFYNGTAPATTSIVAFVNGSGAFAANPVGQRFGGGIVVDSNGSSTNLNVNLLAPTGNGISGLTLASGGSGYTGPPIITISDSGVSRTGTTAFSTTIAMTDTSSVFVGQGVSGTGIPAGAIVTAVSPNASVTISQPATTAAATALTFKGVGATAYANVSGGAVTGVVITNPGVGYVGTVTAALGGGFGTGGSGTPATFNAITPTANSSGGLTKNGVGTLTLSGVNTFSGPIMVNAGTIAFGASVTTSYANPISGAGGIAQTGTGTTILTGTGTYLGSTTISSGVLRLDSANALPGGIGATGGASALTFAGGVLGLGFGDYSRPLAAAGTITAANFAGAGGWAAYGAERTVNIGGAASPATVTWATANTGFNAQTLILGNVTATHTVTVVNPLDLGTSVRTVQVDNGAATVDGRLGGGLSGAGGGITKTGAGTLVLASTANAYTGATTVNAGTLLSSASNVIPDASAVTVSGNAANVRAILDVNGRSETIGTLTLGGSTVTSAATVATNAGSLTLGGDVTYANGNNPLAATILGSLALGAASRAITVNDSSTATYDLVIPAAISGSGVGLTKAGTGTLLLTGANTYTGITTVSAGTLTLGTRSALSNDTPANWTPTTIAVNSGATLALGVGSAAAGYFGAADIDTLLDASHLGASTTTTGLKTGSVIGFDTTNASGGAFTYSSTIADTTGSTPTAVNVAKLGPGTLTLGGNNTYTGTTTVSQGTLVLAGTNTGTGTVTVAGGVLRADQGVGLNSGSLLTLSGGVLETGANLERSGGSTAGTMQITGGTSGFSAAGIPVQVAFGTLASPTALTWGTAPFAPGTLLLNAATATNTLDFKNAINLGTAARTIQVDANVATMSGIVSNGSTGGTLTKTGNGTLVLPANNTFNAVTTVTAGTLVLSGTNASTSTYTARSGGALKINGATGSIPTTAAVTLGNASYAGGGAFVYDNVGASGQTSQTIASLTTSISQPDDNTVQVIRTVAQPVSLIVTTLSSNASENGNVINFVTTDVAGGGVNGTDYKIVLGNQTNLKISSQNAYYNGGDFAVYQGSGLTGYVRGIAYGTDANTATSAGGASFAAPGTLTSQEITGSITAQPATTLASGTLNGSLKIVGSSDLTMQLNASLTFNGSGNSGTGGILKTGGGTSTISGGAGTTGVVNLTNTQGDIRVDRASDVLTIAMPVTWGGATRLLKSGAGTLIFGSGTLPFTDSRNSMWINGGTFEIGGTAIYNGSAANNLILASGTVFRYASSSVVSFRSGTIQGPGSVQVTAGALALTNTGNSYTGTTTLNGGTLNVASLANGGTASSIGQSSNAATNLVFGGGTLQYTGSTATATDRLFTIGSGATLEASGTTPVAVLNFSNTGPVAFGGTSPRTLTLTGSNTGANTLAAAIGDNMGATSIVKSGAGAWTLTGTNTYAGTTTIAAGTLEVAVGAAIGDASAVSIANVAGARLLVSSNETIGSLAGGGLAGGEVALGFNTLTVGNAASTTFAGTISGIGGGIVKRGGGALVLSGTNTYSGPTSVAAGTLMVNGSTGSGPLAVSAGATLGGSGIVGGAATIAGIHVPGTSPGLQTFSGGLTYGSTATLVWELSANTAASIDRGSLYDGINLTTSGLLTIDPAAALRLVFDAPLANAAPSTVNWDDAFWAHDRQWLLADVQSPVSWAGSLFGQVLVGPDALGQSLSSRRPGSSFGVQQGSADGNLYVTYAAPVPEPGTLAGLAVALGICGFVIGRGRRASDR